MLNQLKYICLKKFWAVTMLFIGLTFFYFYWGNALKSKLAQEFYESELREFKSTTTYKNQLFSFESYRQVFIEDKSQSTTWLNLIRTNNQSISYRVLFVVDCIWAFLLISFAIGLYLKSRINENSVSLFMVVSISVYLFDLNENVFYFSLNGHLYQFIPIISMFKTIFYLVAFSMLTYALLNKLFILYFNNRTHGQ